MHVAVENSVQRSLKAASVSRIVSLKDIIRNWESFKQLCVGDDRFCATRFSPQLAEGGGQNLNKVTSSFRLLIGCRKRLLIGCYKICLCCSIQIKSLLVAEARGNHPISR